MFEALRRVCGVQSGALFDAFCVPYRSGAIQFAVTSSWHRLTGALVRCNHSGGLKAFNKLLRGSFFGEICLSLNPSV
jgi:hypothetical protein